MMNPSLRAFVGAFVTTSILLLLLFCLLAIQSIGAYDLSQQNNALTVDESYSIRLNLLGGQIRLAPNPTLPIEQFLSRFPVVIPAGWRLIYQLTCLGSEIAAPLLGF